MNLLSMMGLDEKMLDDMKEKVQEFIDRQKEIDRKLDEVLKLLEKKDD